MSSDYQRALSALDRIQADARARDRAPREVPQVAAQAPGGGGQVSEQDELLLRQIKAASGWTSASVWGDE